MFRSKVAHPDYIYDQPSIFFRIDNRIRTPFDFSARNTITSGGLRDRALRACK
ncbi:hypothetical protein RP20_CCG007815 [Aedes albopictus]|nr:hypothetical protein RP20_CCG007815 [Aedes albopictus]